MMQFDELFGDDMRTTVTIDDRVYEEVREYAPDLSLKELIELGLKAYARQEALRRLRALGGSVPDAEDAPSRRRLE